VVVREFAQGSQKRRRRRDQTHVADHGFDYDAGNFSAAITHLEQAKPVSPSPAGLQKQIEELKEKLAAQTNAPAATAP